MSSFFPSVWSQKKGTMGFRFLAFMILRYSFAWPACRKAAGMVTLSFSPNVIIVKSWISCCRGLTSGFHYYNHVKPNFFSLENVIINQQNSCMLFQTMAILWSGLWLAWKHILLWSFYDLHVTIHFYGNFYDFHVFIDNHIWLSMFFMLLLSKSTRVV